MNSYQLFLTFSLAKDSYEDLRKVFPKLHIYTHTFIFDFMEQAE